ncbi:MAG: hypothetical protein ACJ718_02960 [Nitrososphaeraceae archaeon]|jgi:hypothetical protein
MTYYEQISLSYDGLLLKQNISYWCISTPSDILTVELFVSCTSPPSPPAELM